MFFKTKKTKTIKKVDKLVTWLIIWWAVAWLLWLSQTKKWKEITNNIKKSSNWVFNKSKKICWKLMIKILQIFKKDK